MHGSVLQGKKYIKFANENTVEVMAMGKIGKGQETKDKRLQVFKGKDGKEYLAGWPNLTLTELKDLARSRAASYNDTGKIPYTVVVDPYTLEKMSDHIGGGYGAGKLEDLVVAARKTLDKAHGKGLSRKKLAKAQKAEDKIRATLEKGDLIKALSGAKGLEKKAAKEPKPLQDKVAKLLDDILKEAGKSLDECEGVIGRGDLKGAARTLGSLTRALKGTALEERANELLAKTKPPADG